MHRPARCLQTTSPDVSDIGQDERCPPICSSPAGAIVWMRETFIEPSMRCLGRWVCEAHLTVGALVCTTCADYAESFFPGSLKTELESFALQPAVEVPKHAELQPARANSVALVM